MTADGRVPSERPQMGYARIVTGAPVRAQQWLDAAYLAHWVAGRGQVVIPGHSVRYALASGSVTMRYRAPMSGRSIARYACLTLRSTTGATRSVTVTMGTGTSVATVGPLVLGGQTPIVVVDEVTRASATTDIDIVVTTSGSVVIETCSIYELPRASLSRDSTDDGIALDTLFPRRPIMSDGSQSVQAVAALMQSIDGRRIGHFARWGEVLQTASGTLALLTHAPYRVAPRSHPSGERELRIHVRALVSGGTTGEVVATSGVDTATVAITSTSAAWVSMDLNVASEDLDEPDGLSAGGDTVKLEYRRTAGGGSVGVEGWSCVENA